MTIWRRSRKEETTSLLSRHHAYSTPQKKNRFSFRTPPMSPADDEEGDNDKYEVDVVASEYDPSPPYGTLTLPQKSYPSTTIRRVEFKESEMPEPFRMPEPELEPALQPEPERAVESLNNVPTENVTEGKPEDKSCTPFNFSGTLGFFDDICQIPRPKETANQTNAGRDWGAVPSEDEDESTFPSMQSTTEYSRSLMTSSVDANNNLETSEEANDEEQSFPDDEEHENFEVVLDSTLLSSPPQSPKRTWYSKESNEPKKPPKRSLVKRLFSVRKKKPTHVLPEILPEAPQEYEEPQEPQEFEQHQEEEYTLDLPELSEETTMATMTAQESPSYEELLNIPIPDKPPSIGHSRSAPPAFRSRSPVDDVFATLGSIFSALDPLGQMVEEEKKEDEVSKDDVGPDDETEANISQEVQENEPENEPETVPAAPENEAIETPPPPEIIPRENEKKKRPLLVGLAKKIRSFTSREDKSEPQPEVELTTEEVPDEVPNKKKPLWKSAVDATTGRTYWYNRVTRASTFDPPPEAVAEAMALEAKAAESNVPQPKESEATEMQIKESVSKAPPSKETEPKKAKKAKPLWKAVVDKNTGRTYYYHRKTRQTTWTMPEELKVAEETAKEEKEETKQEPSIVQEAPKDVPPMVITTDLSRQAQDPTTKIDEPSSGSNIEETEANEALSDKRKEIQRLLNSLTPPDTRDINKLMKEFAGREDVLMRQLRDQVESQPFDEPIVEIISLPKSSPSRISSRTTTFMSKASATTKSSTITDKTERIRNTMVKHRIEPISENMSTSTSISSRRGDDVLLNLESTPIRGGAVPRERELKVEELNGSRVTAEMFDKTGRVVRRQKPRVEEEGSYNGDNEVDTFCTDSVSALSENDADFSHRKENFEQARRRALDDAIEREDWDLAAALSEGMRATSTTGDYTRAHTSWNQSDLDKFIAQNDWGAVKSYIARMRNAKKEGHDAVPLPTTGVDKRVGSRSQLQHKMFVSDSSWTSDSYDSDSFDSDFS